MLDATYASYAMSDGWSPRPSTKDRRSNAAAKTRWYVPGLKHTDCPRCIGPGAKKFWLPAGSSTNPNGNLSFMAAFNTRCSNCHNNVIAPGKPVDHIQVQNECSDCHSDLAWQPVQFSHLHHVRELLDEVFGSENFIAQVTFSKTTGSTTPCRDGCL